MVPHDWPHARVSRRRRRRWRRRLRCEPVASRANLASPPGDGSEPSDVRSCWRRNAYVDNIVSENQRMRSKLLTAMRVRRRRPSALTRVDEPVG